jgi:hypothetical protein
MTWTSETSASSVYDFQAEDATVWDDGDTVWDVVGNVITTHWDYIPYSTSWSKESGL